MIKKYNNEKINELKGVYLLDFYADWCGPCKMLGKVLEEIDNVDIIKINVDEYEELAKEYKIMSIPNMLIIKDGKLEKQIIGFHSKEEIENELESVRKQI